MSCMFWQIVSTRCAATCRFEKGEELQRFLQRFVGFVPNLSYGWDKSRADLITAVLLCNGVMFISRDRGKPLQSFCGLTTKVSNARNAIISNVINTRKKISAFVVGATWLLTPYLPYDLGFIVVFQGEDREVKLLVGQPVPQRVPHGHITMGKGWIVLLCVHAWREHIEWKSAAATRREEVMWRHWSRKRLWPLPPWISLSLNIIESLKEISVNRAAVKCFQKQTSYFFAPKTLL